MTEGLNEAFNRPTTTLAHNATLIGSAVDWSISAPAKCEHGNGLPHGNECDVCKWQREVNRQNAEEAYLNRPGRSLEEKIDNIERLVRKLVARG